MSVIFAILAALCGLALAGFGVFWVGFQTVPAGFPEIPPPEEPPEPPRTAFPKDLPAPLAGYIREALDREASLGDLPAPTSTVIWGRGRYRFFGFMVPMRFRSLQQPGERFLRVLEVTWFGRSVLRIREEYSNGIGTRTVTGWAQKHETGGAFDETMRQQLWREAFWAPAALAQAAWEEEADRRFHCREAGFDAVFDTKTDRPKKLEGAFPTGGRFKASLGAWRNFHGIEIPTQVWIRCRGGEESDTIFVVQGAAYHLDLGEDLDQMHRQLNKTFGEKPS